MKFLRLTKRSGKQILPRISFRLPRITRKNILPLLAVGAAVFVLLSVGGFAFAAKQEEQDVFCSSCHTQPESTYYQRSLETTAVDLASAHRLEETRCIDCHSGEGVFGRVTAELMGASNAFKWYTGLATQPAPLIYPIGDSHCLKCHEQILTEEHDIASRTKHFGPKGHYHSLLPQWKDADKKAADCTSCHFGHDMGSATENSWVIPSAVQETCEGCHDLMGTE